MENKNRAESFKKNDEVEKILKLLDGNLTSVEQKLTSEHTFSDHPTIFIFGCARSGTTVLHQYLIQNIKCIYPSNFISRFYYAPYIGGLYYKLFTDLDKRGELLGNIKEHSKEFYSSDLGKTEGIHSPNEFWYFWRKHFPINQRNTIDKNGIKKDKTDQFAKSIFALQNLFAAPFVTKGMIANNCIDVLEKIFPKVIFIFIRRDLFANAKSLYKARMDYFQTPKKWYSFYPKRKEYYQNLQPEEQVVRQVLDTNEEIAQSLNRCDSSRVIRTDYATFCQTPLALLKRLKNIEDTLQINKKPHPTRFTVREKKELQNGADQKIKSVIENIPTK